MSSTPAGWYPQEDGRQRYWDGERWTEHFAPGVGNGAPVAPAAPHQGNSATAAPYGSSAAAGQGQAVAAEAKPWFKKKRLLIPAGIVALIVAVNAFGGGDDATTAPAQAAGTKSSASPAAAKPKATAAAPAATKAAAKPAPKVAGVGTKVRDGKFEFTVTSVKCGIAKVGTNEYLEKKAQGQYCAVTMLVANIGDEPQSMFADNQYAYDSKDRKLSADSEASIYDEKSKVLWEEINPGNSVTGKVYFDLPKAEKISKLELHDSMFSGGVDVKVS